MSTTRYYKVGGHLFSVSGEAVCFELMTNYEPFEVQVAETREGETCFALSMEDGSPPAFTEELRQDEEGQVIVCGKTADGKAVFEFQWWDATAGWLVCTADYHEGRLITTGKHTKGTGKSTHARLWLKYIEGTELVNDDNPVVSIDSDGRAIVHGSPWSGKTSCYRNISYPLDGLVLLSQAPHNKIRRLKGIEAYAALVPSISGKRWDAHIADGLHQTENAMASHVPIWHLECLPDEEAARVCQKEIER